MRASLDRRRATERQMLLAHMLASVASVEKYRQIVENANDIIFTIDRDGFCVAMNRAGYAIAGCAERAGRGVHVADLVVAEHRDAALRELGRVLDGATISRFEVDVVNVHGERLTLELSGHPVRVGAIVVSAQGIARDITARRALEAQFRQAQKMEVIGRLAGGVAHDFSNLLTVIMVCADLAFDQLDPASPVRSDLDEIRRAATSGAALSRRLLMFGRKNPGRREAVDLNALAQGLHQMLRRLIGESIAFNAHYDRDIGCVMADAGQIEQILLNLVVNARDAMPDGGRLIVETGVANVDAAFAGEHDLPGAGRFVTLTVADTGCGMPPDVQAQIFDPFFTTKDPTRGTGLGLATVRGIAREAGGCVTVVSAAGRGTTFTVYLPSVERPPTAASAPAPRTAAPAGAARILLVEDDDNIRSLATRVLCACGHVVWTARHAEEALTVAERCAWRVDLLLTDIVMPGLNGRLLAERMRREYPSLKVLYMSGYSEGLAGLNSSEPDRTRFLPKPYTPAVLVSEVAGLLGTTVGRR